MESYLFFLNIFLRAFKMQDQILIQTFFYGILLQMKGIRIQYQQLTKKIQSLLINTKPEVSFNLIYRKLSSQFFKLTQILLEQIDVDTSIQQVIKQTIDKFKIGVNKYNQQQISDSEDQSEYFNSEYDEVKNFMNQFHQNKNSNDEIERNALYKYLSDVSYKQKNIDDLMKHMNQNKRNNFQPLHLKAAGLLGNQSLIISNADEQIQTDLNMSNITKILDQYNLECERKKSMIIFQGAKHHFDHNLLKNEEYQANQANKQIKQQHHFFQQSQERIKKNQLQKSSSKNSNNEKTKNLQQKRTNAHGKAKQITNSKLKSKISNIKRISKNKQQKLDKIRQSIQVQVNLSQLPLILGQFNVNANEIIYQTLTNKQYEKSLQQFTYNEETNSNILNKRNRTISKTNLSRKSEESSNKDNLKVSKSPFQIINQPESSDNNNNAHDLYPANNFSSNQSKQSQIGNNKFQNSKLPRKISHQRSFSKDLPTNDIASQSSFGKKYQEKLIDNKKTNTVHLYNKKGTIYEKPQQDKSVICEQKGNTQDNVSYQLNYKKDSLKHGLGNKILKQKEKNLNPTRYNQKGKRQQKYHIAGQHLFGQIHQKINLDKQDEQNYSQSIQQIGNKNLCQKQTKRKSQPSLDDCKKAQIVFPMLTKNIHHQSHHQYEQNTFLYKYTTFCSLSNPKNKKCYNPNLHQKQKKMMRQIQQLCQHTSQRNNKQVAMFIQFIQAMHKRQCGDKCQHLEKFYEFLKKRSIPHRQQIIMHKKDLMFQ